MKIKPDRLKKLRKQKNISREDLAVKSKISKRQIARLESGNESSGRVREYTLMQLAKALKVNQGVLIGELPMPEFVGKDNEKKRIPITTLMTTDARLGYELIKRRYDIIPTTLINMAPLFFVLLAEGSLAWRREKLSKFFEAADQISSLSVGPDYFSFVNVIDRSEIAADEEQKSIRNLDLFGEKLSDETYELGYDPDEGNPFADYLAMLSSKIEKPDLVDMNGYIQDAPVKGFPAYTVCESELNKITNGSSTAAIALRLGRVRLTDIPDDLWAEDKSDERARWIEGQDTDLKDILSTINPEEYGPDKEKDNEKI